MDPQIKKNLTDSEHDFKNIVWPTIKNWLGGGEIIPIENVTDSYMAQNLDRKAGIDIWHMTENGIRGIASRVQWGTNWKTFTVRAQTKYGSKTELQKRYESLKAADKGWLYPAITCQAFLTERGGKGNIMSVGAVSTEDLIPIAMRYWKKKRNVRVTYSHEMLVYLRWETLINKYGIEVKVWPDNEAYRKAALF